MRTWVALSTLLHIPYSLWGDGAAHTQSQQCCQMNYLKIYIHTCWPGQGPVTTKQAAMVKLQDARPTLEIKATAEHKHPLPERGAGCHIQAAKPSEDQSKLPCCCHANVPEGGPLLKTHEVATPRLSGPTFQMWGEPPKRHTLAKWPAQASGTAST